MEKITRECRGGTPSNVFALFGNSAIISYHSVNSVIHPHLAFQTSEFVYVVRLALKFNSSSKVINI